MGQLNKLCQTKKEILNKVHIAHETTKGAFASNCLTFGTDGCGANALLHSFCIKTT
jgi:hypothetical protein